MSVNNQDTDFRTASPPADNPTEKLDMLGRINGMYRLLNLYQEQGSGGLVDKILIAQNSLADLMNQLAPRSYASLTRINFAALDDVAIKPLGIYGDKAAIVQFLHAVAGLDDESAAHLLNPIDTIRLNQPALSSGLYFLLPDISPNAMETDIGHQSFVIYWPEDTTWNDDAIGAVRRNRTTFMRYLTKLTPQVRCLMSKDHADSIVWKGADQEQDEYDEDFVDDGSDDDEISHERLFKFEVSKTTDQEEGANIYPGFQYADHHIATKVLPQGVTLPPGLSPSLLETKLVSGESLYGFLTSTFVPRSKKMTKINQEYTKVNLVATLQRYKNIRLGSELDEDGVFILLEDGGLGDRVLDSVTRWKGAIREVEELRQNERANVVKQAGAHFASHRAQLVLEVRAKLSQAMVAAYPFLNPKRLNPDGRADDKLEYLQELYTCYPAMRTAESDAIKAGKITTIDSKSYKRIKTRLLENQDILMASERLFPSDLEDLMNFILKDVKKDESIFSRIYHSLASWVKPERTPYVYLPISDQDFLSNLTKWVDQKPILKPFLRAVVLSEVYPCIIQKLDSITSALVEKIELIFKRDSEGQGKIQANAKAQTERQRRFKNFKDELQRHFTLSTDAVSLTVSTIRRKRDYRYGYPSFEVKGEYETEYEPYIQYTLFSLNLKEGDNANIQDDSLFIPRPHATTTATFEFPITDSIRHIQAIGNKVLLIVDNPANVSLWLIDRSKVVHGRPIKTLDASQRKYHFSVSEQRHSLAIAYTEPLGKLMIQIQSFDETFSTLQTRGSPRDLTSWYQDGPPHITHICFASGPEEVCLIEQSGRARIYSFVSQGFRAAMLQIPSLLEIQSVHSAPDNSSLVVVEKEPLQGYQLRVYHWNSFGQLPRGFLLPLPDGFDFHSATEFGITSIGQRTNVAIIAIMPDQSSIQCVNVRIKAKNTSYSFKSKDMKNAKVLESTVHNSLVECYADVWSRYPVVSAIKRETITTPLGEHSPSLNFVCNVQPHIFSSYFKRMIREFEHVTKKPTGGVLDNIKVHSMTMEDADWHSTEARNFKAGEWFVELLCLIPIHIAVAQYNGFVPLKDGVFNPIQEQQLLGATVDQIIDSISLGWYESVFNSYMATKPVKVVSSMGEQSVGKSFTLNHVVDSSFAGSALRTTEGVWLSVCPTRDTLIVALDFEGVHSIERSPQEDMLLVLFNTAISNMVLFRNNFALSRDVANMFMSFQASTALLDPATNPKLFKSLLTIIIKDVVEGDKKEIVKEFTSKFSRIVSEEQEDNFITVLHASQLTVMPWPVIQSRPFYTLFSRVKALLLKQPITHATAGEFLLTLKTLMAKLKAQDWGAIDQNLTKHRVALLTAMLPSALTTGYAELLPEAEELRNLDNQSVIPWGNDSRNAVFCVSGSPTDRAAALEVLIGGWKPDAARHDVAELSRYLDSLVAARLSHVQEWMNSSISRFPADNADIRSLKQALDDCEALLKAGVQICCVGCSSCHLPCLLPRAHGSDKHSCQTSHQCLATCDYVDDHIEDDKVCCRLPAGHAGRHVCDPTAHSCGEPCDLGRYRGCQSNCSKMPGHIDDGHLCSARRHQCDQRCNLKGITFMSANSTKGVYSCPQYCDAEHDEIHEIHICSKSDCPIKCELCSKTCTTGNHLHGLIESELHLCNDEHECRHKCEEGICKIDTEPRSVETTYIGTHETFQFTKYTQIANRRQCAILIAPGYLGHAGPHSHSTEPDPFHYCNETCANCGYICILPLNHPQAEHETKHGSMENTSWAIEGDSSAVVEVQGRKFAARDGGAPLICSSVCTQLGRHAHIDYCRSQDGSCQGNESLHIKEKMLPNSDRSKDWISHKLFWARTGFKDPYSREEQADFSRCDVQCSGQEHEATATAPARPSFCTLPIFHPPQPSDWNGAGNGYVSTDGHAFGCVNPNAMRQAFHVIFVLDRSSSMGSGDRKPLKNTPSAGLIAANNNNRFGAVLSALHGFWMSRSSVGGTRRDAYSVVVFNSGSQVVVNNDLSSSHDELLSRVVTTRPSGGTHFDGALKLAQTTMETHWASDRSPVIIFLSDGECSVSDPVVYDICNSAVALGKALSFHAVSFGDNRWSHSLRRMVTIAEEVVKNAPRDPLGQTVPCGYTDAIDTIRLAETFLNIADSLKKPRASLIRSSL